MSDACQRGTPTVSATARIRAPLTKGERVMSKWTSVVLTGLACCLAPTALTALGCPPPPPLTQDYLKKTVRVEIKGKLVHVHRENDRSHPRFAMLDIAFIDYWQVVVGDRAYELDFRGGKHFFDLANKLKGKTVMVTGTLDGGVVRLTEMKADEDHIQETTEVEVRGRLQSVLLRCGPGSKAWSIVVDGKTYSLDFATPELRKLAETLDGKTAVITGDLKDDAVAVKTLKAAE
jgi:hypothetical protein